MAVLAAEPEFAVGNNYYNGPDVWHALGLGGVLAIIIVVLVGRVSHIRLRAPGPGAHGLTPSFIAALLHPDPSESPVL